MKLDEFHGFVALCTFLAACCAAVAGVAAGLCKLLHLGAAALTGAGGGCLTHAVLMVLGVILALAVVMPLGIVAGLALLVSCVVLALGLLWLLGAGIARAAASRRGLRVERGLRVSYFHWNGGWRDGWRGVPRETAGLVPPTGFWASLVPPNDKDLSADAKDELMARAGEQALAPVYFAFRAPVVAALWGPRAAASAAARAAVRWRRQPRECRECHAWTLSPAWKCPHCGAIHEGIGPSDKFGFLEWHCACGTRLPALAVTGRRELAAVCPECGGALDPVERGRADIAFLGAPAAAAGRLWRAFSADAETRRRPVRLYAPEAGPFRSRHWEHVGAVVFAVAPADLHAAGETWERWRLFMEREFPRRPRRMACALALDASAAELAPDAGKAACRDFLERLPSGGNLLNGLGASFRRVRLFAAGTENLSAFAALRKWTLAEAAKKRL